MKHDADLLLRCFRLQGAERVGNCAWELQSRWAAAYHQTKRRCFSAAMYLCVVRISKRWYKDARILLVVRDIVFQSDASCLIVSSYLSISLWVLCGRCQMFDTFVPAYSCKESAHKLEAVVGWHVVLYAQQYDRVGQEDVRYMFCAYLSGYYCSC